jgi:hypothetical protein
MNKLLLIAAVVALIGCSPADGPSSSESSSSYDAANGLQGVVTVIPVSLPSKVTGRIEGGDLNGKTHAYTWFLETSAKREDVVAFYDQKLSHATKTPYGDGSAMWAFTPDGASDAAGERATVFVTAEGKIEIIESLLKEKRRGK